MTEAVTMNPTLLRQLCVQQKLYRTPELNDLLYLHFKGFTRIAGLEEYKNVKSMYLEGNALSSFQGLPPLQHLKCMFAQQNLLTSLQGLEQAPALSTLNVSSNHLTSLQGLGACPHLGTLTAADNYLCDLEGLEPLLDCPELQTVDLQSNKIEDAGVLDLVARLPALRCLYLKGNPVVSRIKNYRKVVVAALPGLTYLDDRPVDEQERRCATAWSSGGLDAEREERQRYKDEQAAKDRANFEFILNLRKQAFRKRRQLLGLPEGDTDPALDGMSSGPDPSSSGSGAEEEEGGDGSTRRDQDLALLEQEPPELRAARSALAAYTARPGAEEPPELTRARQQLARGGAAIREGRYTGGASAAEDGAIYLASVASAQHDLDAAGPGLMSSARGDLAFVHAPAAPPPTSGAAAAAAAAAGGLVQGSGTDTGSCSGTGGCSGSVVDRQQQGGLGAVAAAEDERQGDADAAAAAEAAAAALVAVDGVEGALAAARGGGVARDDSWGSGEVGEPEGLGLGLEQVTLEVAGEGEEPPGGAPAPSHPALLPQDAAPLLDMDALD